MVHPYFDASSYPWYRPEAKDAYQALHNAIREPARIDRFYQQCGPDLPPLRLNQAPDLIWKDVLDHLSAAKKVETLCREILADRSLEAIHGAIAAIRDSHETEDSGGPAPHPRSPRPWLPAALAFIGLGLAAAALTWFVPRFFHSPTVAVVPFENKGQSSDSYFVEGLSDAVRAKLVSVPGITVLARDSSLVYKRSASLMRQTVASLGAHYLLTGEMRWDHQARPDQFFVTLSLVLVAPDRPDVVKWKKTFDGGLAHVFDVEWRIAEQVARETTHSLTTGDLNHLRETATSSPTAYDAFLRAEYARKNSGTNDSQQIALRAYAEAVKGDPNYALAWARLSETQTYLFANGRPTAEGRRAALDAAEAALRVAANLPEAHMALGYYYLVIAEDLNLALASYKEATRLAPVDPRTLRGLASVERSLGLFAAAAKDYRKSLERDSLAADAFGNLGLTLLYKKEFSEATPTFSHALLLRPNDLQLLQGKAIALVATGDEGQARELIRGASEALKSDEEKKALIVYFAQFYDLGWLLASDQQLILLGLQPSDFNSDKAIWAMCLAQMAALRGDTVKVQQYAQAAKAEYEKEASEGPQPRLYLGWALAYLGDVKGAVEQGERAVASAPKDALLAPYLQHLLLHIYVTAGQTKKALDQMTKLLAMPYFVTSDWVKSDPTLKSLKGDPGFAKLVDTQASVALGHSNSVRVHPEAPDPFQPTLSQNSTRGSRLPLGDEARAVGLGKGRGSILVAGLHGIVPRVADRKPPVFELVQRAACQRAQHLRHLVAGQLGERRQARGSLVGRQMGDAVANTCPCDVAPPPSLVRRARTSGPDSTPGEATGS